jgi:hypothetical protein
VSMAGKWWSDPAGSGVSANVLSASAWSPGGQPAYNDTSVRVTSADPPGPIGG